MADRKITDLTALTTPASADVLPIVDVSEAAAADKNKKVTVGELFKGIPDGTAAAPAIAFESDDGNGLFLSTTDTIGIATNGVSRATVSTTAVTSTLPISATAFSPTSATVPTNGVYLPATNSVGIATNGSVALTVDSSQRLGVGTTSPSQLLHLSSSGPRILLTQTSANSNAFLDAATSGVLEFSADDNNVAASSSIRFKVDGGEKARIDSSGRLGIGTSSPSVGLHVSGATNAAAQIRSSNTTQGVDTVIVSELNGVLRTNTNHALELGTNATTALTIDTSQRVGIGTTSPAHKLVVSNGGVQNIEFNWDGASTNFIQSYNRSTSQYLPLSFYSSQHIFFNGANNSESGRFDSSGRLLVGTSSARSNLFNGSNSAQLQVEGTTYDNSSLLLTCNNSSQAGAYSILALAKSAGSTVGSNTLVGDGHWLGQIGFFGNDGTEFVEGARIGAQVDGTSGANDLPTRLVFSTTADGASSPTERMRIDSLGTLIKYGDSTTARILPQTDNAGYIGEASKRWQAIYAVNGTIQTSDEREKTNIIDSPLGADFIRSLRPVAYRWKIGGYTSTYDKDGKETITPNPGVRTHYGFIAQEVKQAVGETDFGGWLQEDLNDPDSKQSLRLHEFISPIVKALQEALDEIDNLKAEVAALKAQ